MLKLTLGKDAYLEPFRPEHAAELFELTDANRLYLRQWLPWLDATTTVGATLEFIKRGMVWENEGRGPQAGIWSRGRLAGAIGFNAVDLDGRRFRLGYWIAQDAQGRGLITAACRALIGYGFGELAMKRAEICCAVENKRSRAVPERLGFQFEGVQEKAENLYGRLVDHAVYVRTVEGWRR